MERKTRRNMALPVSLQVGASNVGPNHDDSMSVNITLSLFNLLKNKQNQDWHNYLISQYTQ